MILRLVIIVQTVPTRGVYLSELQARVDRQIEGKMGFTNSFFIVVINTE